MIQFPEKHRKELRAFLSTEAGFAMMAWLRENPPKQPSDTNLEPHHIQVHYGTGIGWSECLKKIEKLALRQDQSPEDEDEEEPSIKDTMRR